MLEENEGVVEALLAPVYNKEERDKPFKAVLDSGASDHVGDGSAAPEIPVEPSPGSQRGLTYGCAGGKEIPNEGQQRLPLVTCSGNKAGLTFQVAEVSKNLASVSKVCDMGNA